MKKHLFIDKASQGKCTFAEGDAVFGTLRRRLKKQYSFCEFSRYHVVVKFLKWRFLKLSRC